jgi:PAS domain S-box-containing protein
MNDSKKKRTTDGRASVDGGDASGGAAGSKQRREAQIPAKETRMELALEVGHVGFWDWNALRGELLYHNPLGQEGSGPHSAGRVCMREDAVHKDDTSCISEAIQGHLENQTPFYEVEHRIVSESGEWRWVLCRGKVVEWAVSGEPLRVSGVHVDITEQKRAQEETELRREQLVQS